MKLDFQIDKITNLDSIKMFLESSEKIKDTYMVKRDVLDDNWIKFNTDVGKSLKGFYEYTLELYPKLSTNYDDIRFYSFYFDFILSKPSNSIFTETPKKSKIDLFPRNAKKISIMAQNLYNMSLKYTEDTTTNDNFNKHFQEFFTNSFAYFDFLFYKERGVFSKFYTDSKLFGKQKDFITNKLDNIENMRDLKSFLKDIVKNNIIITMNFKTKNKSSYTINNIFKKYIEYQENAIKHHKENTLYKDSNIIRFEIFSYTLANKLWKYIKIVQKTPEFENKSNEDEAYSNLYHNLTSYIKNYLNFTEEYYKGKISIHNYYLEIHTIDFDFIKDNIFKTYLLSYKDNTLPKYDYTLKKGLLKDQEETITADNLKQMLSSIILNEEYEKFKFYRFIAHKSSSEIAAIINILHSRILEKNKIEELKNTEYMGMLRSGSFLTHCLNILKIYTTKNNDFNATSFLSYPYIAILPRLISKRNGEIPKRFIYIDEAIKSGYSLSIADIHRKTFLQHNSIEKSPDDSALVLADFTDYNDKFYKNHESILDVKRVKVNSEYELEFSKENDILIKKQFNWEGFIKTLHTEDLNTKLLEVAKFKNNEYSRIDITRILSNSILFFTVILDLVKKFNIEDDNKSQKRLIFFAGSTEGRVMVDLFVFIYKILSKDTCNQEFYLDGRTVKREELNQNDYKTIFIDLSINSGCTMKRTLELDLRNNLDENKNFDYILSLFKNKNYENNKDNDETKLIHISEIGI